jgi:ligand-binding sensor domain-containing protein
MKQFTFAIFIFSLITSSSQAQRGWRLFDQFGKVNVIHESRGVLWLGTSDGLWRYHDSGWQRQTQVTGQVWTSHQDRDGTLWLGGTDGLWHYDGSGWQKETQVTGQVHEETLGTKLKKS